MLLNIKNAHLFYEDMMGCITEPEPICECIDSTQISDKDNYYLICSGCGICIDTTKDKIFTYNETKNLYYRPKRQYKRSSYLRLKINQLFRNPLPPIPEQYLNILKKKQNLNITILIKYMKKKKLIKKYDPLKSIFLIKDIEPIHMSDGMITRLIDCFCMKEKMYKEYGQRRFNYNFIILKIFQEWNEPELFKCFKSLQDQKIIQRNETIYNMIFM